jgi:hypothetical protein
MIVKCTVAIIISFTQICINVFLPRWSRCVDEIIAHGQCGFRLSISTTDQIPFVRQILEWEYNETLYQIFMDFKKTYDSVRRKVLYNILIDNDIPMKLVRLIKVCLNETYCQCISD